MKLLSRMESHSVAGQIQLTAATRARLGTSFPTAPRGVIRIKGKGEMETWFLEPPADWGSGEGGATC